MTISANPSNSRLAITSLVTVFLAWLYAFGLVPGTKPSKSTLYGAMIVATILPIAAIIRIRLSGGTCRGTGLALIALFVAMTWWGLWYVFSGSGWRG